MLGPDGRPEPLDRAGQDKLLAEVVGPMTEDSLRAVCIAYRDLDSGPVEDEEEELASGLTRSPSLSEIGHQSIFRVEPDLSSENEYFSSSKFDHFYLSEPKFLWGAYYMDQKECYGRYKLIFFWI